MTSLAAGPFPFEAVRDALGLVRLAYAARSDDQRARLEAVGRELRLALQLAKAGDGTLGHRAAVERVQRVVMELDDLLGDDESGTKLAGIAKARILGEPVAAQKAG